MRTLPLILALFIGLNAHAVESRTKRVDRLERKLDTIQQTLNNLINQSNERSEKLSKLKACYANCRSNFKYIEGEPEYRQEDRNKCYDSCEKFEPSDYIGN
jgi:chromosome segregation ATPase